MKRIRIGLAAIAPGAAALALSAPGAQGHTRVIDSDVTLGIGSVNGGQDTAWYGFVSSPRARCVNNRKVTVFQQLAGPDLRIGQDVTGSHPAAADNEYVVYQDGYPPPDGTYYAKVFRKVLVRSDRHRHACGAARSESLSVGSFR